MKNINPFFLATGLVFLVCGYAWAGGSIEFLGNFSGGTVGAPTVFTGDNSGGVGTVRIRPSDEDTQLVLCEASNNASPEVCSVVQHYNQSVTAGSLIFGSNIYLDNTSAYQRYNTSFGSGYIQTVASSTLSANGIYWGAYNTSGSVAGYNTTLATGASTATNTFGAGGTVTNDFRGPIQNGGSATCNGVNAGAVCISDTVVQQYGADPAYLLMPTATSQLSYVGWMNSSGTVTGANGYGGSTYADLDLQDKTFVTSVGKTLLFGRSDDVAATSVLLEVRDNYTGTGVQVGGIYGDGSDFKSGVTPTALSGDVNDYAGCTLSWCRISGGAANRNITGIASGADGKIFNVCNIGTTNTLVLVDESASSTAANRFALDSNITIPVERCQRLVYDGTSSRWRAQQ